MLPLLVDACLSCVLYVLCTGWCYCSIKQCFLCKQEGSSFQYFCSEYDVTALKRAQRHSSIGNCNISGNGDGYTSGNNAGNNNGNFNGIITGDGTSRVSSPVTVYIGIDQDSSDGVEEGTNESGKSKVSAIVTVTS